MRWTTYITIALAIFNDHISKVTSEVLFELELLEFVNEFDRNNLGNCCSGYVNKNGECSEKCSIKFRVCLDVYQKKIDPNSQCTFGEKLTPVLSGGGGGSDHSSVDFSTLDNFVNPLQFKLDSWQQGTFSLIIEALHEVNNETDFYDGPVLVTRLMTQNWLDIDTQWTEDVHTSRDTSLKFKYRVVCQDHYHGVGCRKWCHPRDDSFGHYTCNQRGDPVCLPGWKEPTAYCDQPICSAGCKGFCHKANECICALGWEGPKCDQCIVYPGCLHGTCDQPWDCKCKENWGGMFCDLDLIYCTNHKPCKNGATCFNTSPGSYSCKCPIGYNGTNCEIVNDSCSNNPCENGGTCLDTDNRGFVCQCKPGFTGRFCERSGQTCNDAPCRNGAACTDTPSGFLCHCPQGFDGVTCEGSTNECASSPCLNNGLCVDEHNTFKCVCPSGYSGSRCEHNVNDCAHDPCLNGGKCFDGVGKFTCQCISGFVGHLCQTNVDDCKPSTCRNGGTCTDGINDFECKCRPGWGGKQCSFKMPLPRSPCENNPCDNGGGCRIAPELAGGYRCICPPGVLGPRCKVLQHHLQKNDDDVVAAMSPLQIVLIVTFSVAVPLLAIVSAVVIACMKRKRRRDLMRHDEEARRQNERNAVHNAANNKNLTHGGMIFNSLEYPTKPLNTQLPSVHHDYHCQKNSVLENAYSVAPARSTKTLNTDVSRMSLASRLEKDLDAYTMSRNSPVGSIDPEVNKFKTSDPHLPRAQSHSSDVFLKRSSAVMNPNLCVPDVCVSTNTLTSTCSPSTCTTPSSVYVIEEHLGEEGNFIATEV